MRNGKPKVVFFTWMKEGSGGSGVEEVARRLTLDKLGFQAAAVVSPFGKAKESSRLQRIRALATPEAGNAPKGGVQFVHFKTPKWWKKLPQAIQSFLMGWKYEFTVAHADADYASLSGWLKLVPIRSVTLWGKLLRFVGLNRGLDPRKTINIHPAPLPEVGGAGVYGAHAHEKVMELYRAGRLTHSAVSMHFATARYDEGPIIFKGLVKIREDDTPETLGVRVNGEEHKWQAYVTNLVATGQISWDGIHKSSLRVPEGYEIERELA